jgi:fumarylacetoacetase
MYWTLAQMVTHHASNGCDLHPGDLLGTGTLSGATPDSFGSLLELARGKAPITLASGETRCFLEDGDEITLRATANAQDTAASASARVGVRCCPPDLG